MNARFGYGRSLSVRSALIAMSVVLGVAASGVATSVAAAARHGGPGRPSSAGSPTPADPTIRASGTRLVLNGSTYRFIGVNAYELITQWGVNVGCGPMLSDSQLTSFFGALPPHSLVRIGALEGSAAINVHTGQVDWGPIDRVFAAAAASHQLLVVTLATQGGTCDNGQWQDPSWFEGGFRQTFDGMSPSNGRAITPLSYWQYVQAIVARYRNSPALGMWEPINEPEPSACPTLDGAGGCSVQVSCANERIAARALRSFYDAIGGEIHGLDPRHLVESGLLGGGQCGAQGADFGYVSASPGVDVLSYHDYYGESALGGDKWNGIAVRLEQAKALGKPIIGGEVGMVAGDASGCLSLSARDVAFRSKELAQFKSGSSGLLAWDWVPSPSGTCSYDVGPADPMMQTIDSWIAPP